MDTLRKVEDILGDVECWSTYLIYDIFVVEPNRNNVKNVAAFIDGNGIPIEKAVHFYCMYTIAEFLCIMCFEGFVFHIG
jgi:hypothetical protein